MTISPAYHPLLHHMRQGARWIGQDAYPAWGHIADEHETWLEFINGKGQLGRFIPRLRDRAAQRDETLAEIGVAYFLERHSGLPIAQWEPQGTRGTGEFGVALPFRDGGDMFVEVKSPGWEAEVPRIPGSKSPRLSQPKHIHAQGGWTAPWRSIRDAVKKAYPKMPDSMPTLLVIQDDLMVPLHSWLSTVDIALYCPRGRGKHDPASSYLAENGCFVGSDFERLGAVGILNIEYHFDGTRYRFTLFANPHCFDAVSVPRTIFLGNQRTDGTEEVS